MKYKIQVIADSYVCNASVLIQGRSTPTRAKSILRVYPGSGKATLSSVINPYHAVLTILKFILCLLCLSSQNYEVLLNESCSFTREAGKQHDHQCYYSPVPCGHHSSQIHINISSP